MQAHVDAAPLSAATSARSNATSAGPLSHRLSTRLPPQHPGRSTPRPLSAHAGLIASPSCSYAWLVNDNPVATANPPNPPTYVPPTRPATTGMSSPPAIPEERAQTAPVWGGPTGYSEGSPDSSQGAPSGSLAKEKAPHGTPRGGRIWGRIKGRRESEDGGGKLRTWLRGRERVKKSSTTPRDETLQMSLATVPPAGMLTDGQDHAGSPQEPLGDAPGMRSKLHTAPEPEAEAEDRRDGGLASGLRTVEVARISTTWSDTVPEENEEEEVEGEPEESRWSSSTGRRASVAAPEIRPTVAPVASRRMTLAAPASRTVSPPKMRRGVPAAAAAAAAERTVSASRRSAAAASTRTTSPLKATGSLRDRRASLAPSAAGRSASYGTGPTRRPVGGSSVAARLDTVKHSSVGTGVARRASMAPTAGVGARAASAVGAARRGSLAPTVAPRGEDGSGGRRASLAVGAGGGRRDTASAAPRLDRAGDGSSRRMSVAAPTARTGATRERPSTGGGIRTGRRVSMVPQRAAADEESRELEHDAGDGKDTAEEVKDGPDEPVRAPTVPCAFILVMSGSGFLFGGSGRAPVGPRHFSPNV